MGPHGNGGGNGGWTGSVKGFFGTFCLFIVLATVFVEGSIFARGNGEIGMNVPEAIQTTWDFGIHVLTFFDRNKTAPPAATK